MIALIFAVPGAGNTINFAEMAGDTVRSITRGARTLSVVPKAKLTSPAANAQLTVAQFCEQRGVMLSTTCMSRIGRKASALSRAAGLTIGRAVEAYGEVNAYDADVLALAFAFIEASKH